MYLTTQEAADRFLLSRRYLEELRRTGRGPAYVAFGKAIRYRVEDLEQWAAGLRRRSTSDSLGRK